MSVPRAARRRKQCIWGSPSDLVGRASQTWEGGNAPAGLVRRTHAVDKTSGRPTTGATYNNVLHVKLEACTLTSNACCSLPISTRHCARAVKGMDSKSIGLCPQGFESPRCRSLTGFQLTASMASRPKLRGRELNPDLPRDRRKY